MYLNTIKPAQGAKKKSTRLGRGIGSGLGKTSGKGHKGQKARSGGYHKLGFEGGQMPLQRRLPKFGFTSSKQLSRAEIRLSDLDKISTDIETVTLDVLRSCKIINNSIKTAKVILSGTINRAIKISGIAATKGAKAAIEAAGGSILNDE